MRLYADSELSTPIDVIHLGTVTVGTQREYTLYAVNPTRAVYENIMVTLTEEPEGLGMYNIPTRLGPGEMAIIRVVWSPPLTMREALTVGISIRGNEIYYA